MFTISMSGDESPKFLRAIAAGLNAIAEHLTGLPAQTHAPTPLKVSEPLPPADEPKAEAKVSKSQAKRPKVQQESPETATADQSAVIAEAKAAMERERDPFEAAEPVKAEEGKPAPEVTVEQLREAAKTMASNPDLRDRAMQILKSHGAKSVTELGERDNIVRVSALNEFLAAAAA